MRLKTPPVTLTGKIERLVPGENVTLVNGEFHLHVHTDNYPAWAHIGSQQAAHHMVAGWATRDGSKTAKEAWEPC